MIDKLSPEARTFLSDFLAQIEYEKDKEIERLNNIINELEEYMIGKDIYKILLYKLRDLKESDKE